MSPALQKALLHGLKVFIFAGVSAVIPVAIAVLSNNPNFLLFIPVINALWAGIQKFVTEHNLLAGKV